MHNVALVAVIGILFAVSLFFTTKAQDDYTKIIEENVKISSEQDEKNIIEAKNFFKKYDISDLKVGYAPPRTIGNKTVLIDVPIINQFPELPVGCEITSATSLLNFLGFPVNKVYMAEKYLISNNNFWLSNDGVKHGPDPSKVFVGNPKKDGFGCFAPVIVNSVNRYFADIKSECEAVQLFESNSEVLEGLLDNGIPSIVWASRNMKPFRYDSKNEWVLDMTAGQGQETLRWASNSHTLVLVGYDDKDYYFADCDDKSEIQFYKKTDFIARWEEHGNQIVTIKRRR